MRIDDVLYFAPNVRFDEVDFTSPALPDLFAKRLRGFYLEPAARALEYGDAFAAGVLLVACIDSLARFDVGGEVGERFRSYAEKRLPSFGVKAAARSLYRDFRNGLVHESRIKRGAQFSLDMDPEIAFQRIQGVAMVNPCRLLAEVDQALDLYIDELSKTPQLREAFAEALREDHVDDHQEL